MRRKLDNRSEKNIFVGYSAHGVGFRLYNPESNFIHTKREVEFLENTKWVWNCDTNKPSKEYLFIDPFVFDQSTNDLSTDLNSSESTPIISPHSTPSNQLPKPTLTHHISQPINTPINSREPSPSPIVPTQTITQPNVNYLGPSTKRIIKTPTWLKDYYTGNEKDDEACRFALTVADHMCYEQA